MSNTLSKQQSVKQSQRKAIITEFIKKISSTDSSAFTILFIINDERFKLIAVNFDSNNDIMLNLTVINSNSLQTSRTKQFLYIKIFINKADNSAKNILIEEVKTFLHIKVSKRKQNDYDNK